MPSSDWRSAFCNFFLPQFHFLSAYSWHWFMFLRGSALGHTWCPSSAAGRCWRELFCTLSPNSSGFGDKILLEVWERRYGCRNSGRLCSGCSTALSSASNTPQRTKPGKRITRTGCYDGYDAETGTRKGSGYFTHSSADCCDALTWTLIAWKYDNL